MQVRVLMVCLGNICRSPLAEGILKSKINTEKVFVDSAGTSNYHLGASPDPRSIQTAAKYGIDITKQKGRQFSSKDFDDFDLIFAMDKNNYKNILQQARNEADKNKVRLILNKLTPGENMDVPDPYYGGVSGFDNVYKMLDEATDIIVKEISVL
ncbi:low molecular weight protein-tyrosine-phosphatase [Galbibacter pacificus]|uniref:protein-tyrosine-phosphatase n=1 Tax=Galbibacter pacificus TaxID=2996052 RepID=A0ABT6FPG3_9FLAO|nr:low molecular weight protein-tyrosine-phosphatase [Galbibacter pacificus]MDG3582371.1 low molecular weight phosphotyrosine protein phosphatase [Galbibacter pacificus]MDG3585153.1 low molecular weight phosphotyrosine protein phosphatase [Galbibacter pacificus]